MRDGSIVDCETSELTGPYLWPSNRTAFRTSAVTMVLFHLLDTRQVKVTSEDKVGLYIETQCIITLLSFYL